MGEKGRGRNMLVDFLVFDIDLPYNVIIGRPTLYKIKAVFSTYQLLLQFEADDGKVAQLFGDQKSARECYVNSLKKKEKEEKTRKRKQPESEEPLSVMGVYVAENPKRYERSRPADGDEKVCVSEEKGGMIRIGKQVSNDVRS